MSADADVEAALDTSNTRSFVPPTHLKREHSDDETGTRRIRRKISEASDLMTVVVKVGSAFAWGGRTFVCKRDAFVRHCDAFMFALALSTSNLHVLQLDLPDIRADDFEIFHRFVSYGEIFSSCDGDYEAADPQEPFEYIDHEWARLARAWILGDYLRSCSFKDAVVDALVAKLVDESRYPVNIAETLYPKTKKQSAMRKLLVDIVVWRFSRDDLSRQGHKEELSEFYYDVVVALNGMTLRERAYGLDFDLEQTCKYHEHVQLNKLCYRTMFP